MNEVRDLITAQAVLTDRVLRVNELLEKVLSHLDAPDLARLQRVDQRWREVITGSAYPPLRQALWLSPIDTHSLLIWDKPCSGKHEQWQPNISHDLSKVDQASVVSELHPIFIDEEGPRYVDSRTFFFWNKNHKNREDIFCDWEKIGKWAPGQWRDAFVTQPPCKKVGMGFSVERLPLHGPKPGDWSESTEV